jgi:DNA-binding PadR family transcriptional regulator
MDIHIKMSPRPALPLRCEYALLGLVRRAPIHGYNLLQELSGPDGLSEIWEIKISQVYAFLNKLEDQGYLTSQRLQEGDYPARRLYTITPVGETAFQLWMGSPVPTARDLRQLFMLKLYFAGEVKPEVIHKLISDQIDLCHKWLDSLERERSRAAGWRQKVFAYRIELVRASLLWLGSFERLYNP